MSKVSFVMPTKNRAHLISETIKTVLDQTFQDWELIIVDDNSTDNTNEVVSNFKDQRINYYELPTRLGIGPASARNFGNMLSKSSIILVADSDDLNFPERAQVTYDYFLENPATDFFYAHADVWEMESNVHRERHLPFTPFSIEELKKVNFIPHSTVAYKRKIVLEIPYNPVFVYAEDYDLIARFALNQKKFGFLNQKIATQRFHKGRMSIDRVTQEKYAQLVRMIRNWEDDSKLHELFCELIEDLK